MPCSASRSRFVVPVLVAGAVRLLQRLVHHPLPRPADRRHADPVHRRARHRPGDHQRQPAGLQQRRRSNSSASAGRSGIPVQVAAHAGAGGGGRLGRCGARCSGAGSWRSGATRPPPACPASRSRAVKRGVYVISGLCAGIAGPRGGRDQLVERRQSRRARHGARRDRGRGGRRHAADRRAGDCGRHPGRRADHPVAALHAARQRRSRRRRARGQGGASSSARSGCSSAEDGDERRALDRNSARPCWRVARRRVAPARARRACCC